MRRRRRYECEVKSDVLGSPPHWTANFTQGLNTNSAAPGWGVSSASSGITTTRWFGKLSQFLA